MTAAVLIITIVTLWLGHSYFWPYRPCRGCGGTKKGTGSTRRAYNRCGFCGGTGDARRAGAWLISRATGRPIRTPRRNRNH